MPTADERSNDLEQYAVLRKSIALALLKDERGLPMSRRAHMELDVRCWVALACSELAVGEFARPPNMSLDSAMLHESTDHPKPTSLLFCGLHRDYGLCRRCEDGIRFNDSGGHNFIDQRAAFIQPVRQSIANRGNT